MRPDRKLDDATSPVEADRPHLQRAFAPSARRTVLESRRSALQMAMACQAGTNDPQIAALLSDNRDKNRAGALLAGQERHSTRGIPLGRRATPGVTGRSRSATSHPARQIAHSYSSQGLTGTAVAMDLYGSTETNIAAAVRSARRLRGHPIHSDTLRYWTGLLHEARRQMASASARGTGALAQLVAD